MTENKKAVLPLRAATQEVTALYYPGKNEVTLTVQNNLSVEKDQSVTLGNSAASPRSRILIYRTNDLMSEGHSRRVTKYVLLTSRQLSFLEWLNRGAVSNDQIYLRHQHC